MRWERNVCRLQCSLRAKTPHNYSVLGVILKLYMQYLCNDCQTFNWLDFSVGIKKDFLYFLHSEDICFSHSKWDVLHFQHEVMDMQCGLWTCQGCTLSSPLFDIKLTGYDDAALVILGWHLLYLQTMLSFWFYWTLTSDVPWNTFKHAPPVHKW